jgi:hypothetical protein
MAQLQIKTVITNTDIDSGEHQNAYTFTQSYTTIEEKLYSVAAAGTQIIWDPTTDGSETASTFTTLIVSCSDTFDLELVTDVGGDVGDEVGTVRVASNLPFMIGGDDSYALVTGVDALGTGTLDVIDKIRAKNVSSATATIRVWLAA